MMIILLFVTSAIAACCNGRFGTPINSIDWSFYVTNVKNQTRNDCWAHASTSFIEIMYAYKTGIFFRLSSKQISDNIGEISNICSATAGGTFMCAMDYVKLKGIMTQQDYNENGYDIKKIIPMQVLNIQHEHRSMIYESFLERLNNEPIVIYLHATQNYFEDNINETGRANHVVVALNVCIDSNFDDENSTDVAYIEYLNSYGENWGECNGRGYLRISDNNTFIVNNRNVFSWQMSANVGKTFLMHTFDDNLWATIGLQCGQLFLEVAVIIGILVFCYRMKK